MTPLRYSLVFLSTTSVDQKPSRQYHEHASCSSSVQYDLLTGVHDVPLDVLCVSTYQTNTLFVRYSIHRGNMGGQMWKNYKQCVDLSWSKIKRRSRGYEVRSSKRRWVDGFGIKEVDLTGQIQSSQTIYIDIFTLPFQLHKEYCSRYCLSSS
jgi:hypothetical protein